VVGALVKVTTVWADMSPATMSTTALWVAALKLISRSPGNVETLIRVAPG